MSARVNIFYPQAEKHKGKSVMVSAIILAAGEAKRMGKLKQLLPLGQSTILEKTIENVVSSRVNETIVVLGYQAEKIIPKINSAPVKIIVNPLYQDGMSTSIITGLMAVGAETDAIMLILADQPFIDSQVINHMLDEYKSHNKGIVVPVHRGQRGHPVIISLRYKSELLNLKGDIGAREVIPRHSEDVHEVKFGSPGITVDIDTEEDYDGSFRFWLV
jgi:molybdenum cofactor cytidylyltransferase